MNTGDLLCGSFCTSSVKDAPGTLNLVNTLFTVLVERCEGLRTSSLHHQKLSQSSKNLWGLGIIQSQDMALAASSLNNNSMFSTIKAMPPPFSYC